MRPEAKHIPFKMAAPALTLTIRWIPFLVILKTLISLFRFVLLGLELCSKVSF